MPTLRDIAELLGAVLPGGADPLQRVSGVGSLSEATSEQISFLSSEAYAKELPGSQAAAVVLGRKIRIAQAPRMPLLVVDDADLAVGKVLALFAQPIPRPPIGVDPTARVAKSATIGEGSAIGFNVSIGERSNIGRGSVLHPGVYIGDDVTLGDGCELFPNVVVRERVRLGRGVVIHAGSVLGTDGFGYRWTGTQHAKIPQIGDIVVEDDVEIGSCVCIDRAKFGATVIGRGTKIDNLVQVGHNVRIGPHCIIVGQAGMAGSVKLGAGVVLGGQCAVRDHIAMGDGAILAACSGLNDDVGPKTVVSGLPALPHRQTLREQAALRRLPDLVVQVRKLQEQIEQMRAEAKNQNPEASSQ